MKTRLLQTTYSLPERRLELVVETVIQGTISRTLLQFSQNDLFSTAQALGKTEWDFETIAYLIAEETGVHPSNMNDLYPLPPVAEDIPITE